MEAGILGTSFVFSLLEIAKLSPGVRFVRIHMSVMRLTARETRLNDLHHSMRRKGAQFA